MSALIFLCIAATAVDGDTLRCRNIADVNGRVRLARIDAPEWGERGFGEATEALGAMIAGREVRCELVDADPRIAGFQARDIYGRPVARCSAGGRDLGAAMIERKLEGMAVTRSWEQLSEELDDHFSDDDEAQQAYMFSKMALEEAISQANGKGTSFSFELATLRSTNAEFETVAIEVKRDHGKQTLPAKLGVLFGKGGTVFPSYGDGRGTSYPARQLNTEAWLEILRELLEENVKKLTGKK